MKIISTSDWHLGNLFHGNDRLPEHKHFLQWLLVQIKAQQPDALLIAGDIFDNGNPSAAAQSAYYDFLAEATQSCPTMQIIITAGNHDSANRLEAPRPLLSRYKVEVRGSVHRYWKNNDDNEGGWETDFNDLMIPIQDQEGNEMIVLAVPYLRNDVVQDSSYSQGVNKFLRELTQLAREKHAGKKLIMMAHMYAKGSDIATFDASEKIVIGGQEEVNMEGWQEHPDYLTCGHIHKRQHIWNTDWARYTGSVLPMSFAEKDYTHGVDLITIDDKTIVKQLVYQPQHPLIVLPEKDEELTTAKLSKLIMSTLPNRNEGSMDDNFAYVVLKVKMDKPNNDEIKKLEDLVNSKNAVLCKIQKIIPTIDVKSISGNNAITSVDDILNRDPLETIAETFIVKHNIELNEFQETELRKIIDKIKHEINN